MSSAVERNAEVGEAIHRAVLDFKVERWLNGSRLVQDRPTFAELRAAGYAVLSDADRAVLDAVDAADLGCPTRGYCSCGYCFAERNAVRARREQAS